MSQEVDLNRKPTAQEVEYLHSRGQHQIVEMLEEKFGPVGEPVDETDEPDTDAPYEEWTVAELQAELKGRQLSSDGKKADLVARLHEYDSRL